MSQRPVFISILSILFAAATLIAEDNSFTRILGPDVFTSSAKQMADGGYIVAGGTLGDHSWDALLVRLDGLARVKWKRSLAGGEVDYFNAVVIMNDGGFVAAGTTASRVFPNPYGFVTTDLLLARATEDGNIVWRRHIGGSGSEYLRDLRKTMDGGLILLAETNSFEEENQEDYTNQDLMVIKLNSLGGIEWAEKITTRADDSAGSIVQTSDGNYVLAGWSVGGAGAMLIKLRADGKVLWVRSYPELAGLSRIEVSRDGKEILGISRIWVPTEDDQDILLFKWSAAGSLKWVRRFSFAQNGFGDVSSIAAAGDSEWIIGGSILLPNQMNPVPYIMKLDRAGAVEWKHSFDLVVGSGIGLITTTGDGGLLGLADAVNTGDGEKTIFLKFDDRGQLPCYPFTVTNAARTGYHLVRAALPKIGIKINLPLQIGSINLPMKTPSLAVNPVCR